MIVYRLTRSKYSHDLTGAGAEKSGGRWNSRGTALVYTSDSRALCTAEIAVHTPLGNIPMDYKIISIEIPTDVFIQELDNADLSPDWRSYPHAHSTQEIGDRFIAVNKNAVLKVPSATVKGDFNYLLNPNHPDFQKIKIISMEPFEFDERLFRR